MDDGEIEESKIEVIIGTLEALNFQLTICPRHITPFSRHYFKSRFADIRIENYPLLGLWHYTLTIKKEHPMAHIFEKLPAEFDFLSYAPSSFN